MDEKEIKLLEWKLKSRKEITEVCFNYMKRLSPQEKEEVGEK